MKFSVSIETDTSIRLHSGMPKNRVTGKEFLKLCVTCNDRLWTENKAYCLYLFCLFFKAAATKNKLHDSINSIFTLQMFSAFESQISSLSCCDRAAVNYTCQYYQQRWLLPSVSNTGFSTEAVIESMHLIMPAEPGARRRLFTAYICYCDLNEINSGGSAKTYFLL